MKKPEKHILVCASFRAGGGPQGICHNKGATGFMGYLEAELSDRGMDGVSLSLTSCLKVCDRGPAMVVYPENLWYGGIDSEDDIDAILDAMEDDEVAEEYLLT